MFLAENYPPRFEQTPTLHYTAKTGNVIRLRCMVTGNPAPTISWVKDDKPLQLSSRIRNLNNNRTVKIKDARLQDQGNYTCIAHSALGKINATLELHVRQGRMKEKACNRQPRNTTGQRTSE